MLQGNVLALRLPVPVSRFFMRANVIGFVAVLCLALALVPLQGCSFANFVSAAEADVPVVIQMVSNITNLIAPGMSPEIAAAGALALSSLQILCGNPAPGATACDASSLIGEYKAAVAADNAAGKASVLQKVQAALAAANSQITNMLGLAKGLPTAVTTSITLAIGVALSTVTSLLSIVGTAVVAGANAAASALKTVPSRRSVKNKFNKAIGKQFPKAVVA